MRSVPAVAECSKAVDDCAKAISLSGGQGQRGDARRGKKWLAVVHELCGNLYERRVPGQGAGRIFRGDLNGPRSD